ncbi:MAG TPA: methyltransferase domain-containing protein [Pyrinomonadaceae bacterium]|nr:methyltransferase domain-containing protein [Pyrinomonadaceae bacterium]
MQTKLLDVLACPKCLGHLSCAPSEVDADGEINKGTLECSACRKSYPIEAGIPRFVEMENYASSFGYQWNRFKSEQIDSVNGTGLSEQRVYSETTWTKEWMKGKWILDAGCGAGRFLEVVSREPCEAVGVDLSNATDAARATLRDRKNVHLVQASIYELPFRSGVFDGCYCIGVIQHTPDPQKSLHSLPRVLKRGGRIAVTIYERKPWTKLNAKYLIRPLTKRMSKRALLSVIKGLMPILFPITEVTFRIPYLNRLFMFAIPVANYVSESKLTLRQRYHWAILDTFDMLSPQYDQPQTYHDAETPLRSEGIEEITRLQNGGLNLIGRKTT